MQWFENEGRPFEAKRLQERVTYDMEMIRELGHCSGIENYSRYFDGRAAGTRPYCLLDFFPEDFLIVIDESHVSVPQIRAMYGGDRARKINLVEYGFSLPAAMDNRPLKFDEFEEMAKQVIYVSATPADYELMKSEGIELYSEFKGFFPNNAVEYYVSYYDYYQPEAYLPSSDTYIEKDLAINDEIDKLRLAATSALLSGRKDVVVVSSVSCIYGMGNPADFYNNVIEVQQGKNFSRNVFLRRLVDSLYVRNDIDLNRGNFRVKGDTVDIYLAYADNLLRVTFWGDEVDSIEEVDPMSGVTVG